MALTMDRVNSHYMVILLVIAAVGLFVHNHTTPDPITCWVPAHFTSSHKEYSNKVPTLKYNYIIAEFYILYWKHN